MRILPSRRSLSVITVLIYISLLVGAIGWISLMPRGFPAGHPRFWLNVIVPSISIAFVLGVGVLVLLRRWNVVHPVNLHCALWLIPAACGGLVAFPRSGWLPAAGLVFVSLLLVMQSWQKVFQNPGRRNWVEVLLIYVLTLPMISTIVVVPRLLRGPPAGTQLVEYDEIAVTGAGLSDVPNAFNVGDVARLYTRTGDVAVTLDRYSLTIAPMLTFQSVSPDRCWTILAPRSLRRAQHRELSVFKDVDGRLLADYGSSGGNGVRADAALEVHAPKSSQALVSVTADTRVPDTSTWHDNGVWSHLNSFCQLYFSGHRKLQIAFSPCADAPIDVVPFDYPVGRPARFAYLDADEMFHVVEATSGEKGPFRTLASGPLKRGEPIWLTFIDTGVPVMRVGLLDWASQLDTQLSPTAGWGVPVNAIEFSLEGDSPTSPAAMYVTLAATSVGRGWDSVGHAPGTYRNRVVVERIEGAATRPASP